MLEYKLGKINGLIIKDIQVFNDDRGILYEPVRTDCDDFFRDFKSDNGYPINQIYIVENISDAVRAFHKHSRLIDYFCVVKGNAKFIFYDSREQKSIMQIVNVTDRKPVTIMVPEKVFHGWKADKGTILLSVANNLYMGRHKLDPIDEERIPWDSFGKDIWETEFK